jgi:hypothetical protein
VRASVQTGTIDMWLGLDLLARTKDLEARGPSGAGVPSVSGALSLGCFFPAFSQDTSTQLATRPAATRR